MVYHLVKKDFLLAKRYWFIMLVFAFVLPVFISSRVDFMTGGFFAFFLSTLFIQYLMFNTVSMIEYKFKGSALLCATPYTRRAMVRSKYAFLLAIFVGCYIFYTLTSLFISTKLAMLSLSDVGMSLLILAVIFGTIIPVQYRFGYEKSKYIFMCMIFLFPFVAPRIMISMRTHQIGHQDLIQLPQIAQGLFLGLLSLLILGMSIGLSTRIYANQNL
ncbi:ABC-2 transporter permease [Brevibacillus ginsengisoli]|uniref:ABC-2 transporter permease n=1 Tax=Brevibacillus ginsengisoli TaxID=363854 RepID=UPI003CF8C3A1